MAFNSDVRWLLLADVPRVHPSGEYSFGEKGVNRHGNRRHDVNIAKMPARSAGKGEIYQCLGCGLSTGKLSRKRRGNLPMPTSAGRLAQSLALRLRQTHRPTKGKARQASDKLAGSGVSPPPPLLPGVTVTKALRLPALAAPGGPGGV